MRGQRVISTPMFGYNVTKLIRAPGNGAGYYAYQHWLTYRRTVSGGWLWTVNQYVLIRDFTVHGVSAGYIKARVERIEPDESVAGHARFFVRVTGRKSRWYDVNECVELRGYDIYER